VPKSSKTPSVWSPRHKPAERLSSTAPPPVVLLAVDRPPHRRRGGQQPGRLIKRARIGKAVHGEVDGLKAEVGYLGN